MASLYMGIVTGNLIVLLNSGEIKSPFMTANLTLNNGRWHNASLAYTKNG
jgi:hypothetical protein